MRRDVISAYAVTAARLLAWAIVAAMIFRWFRPRYFAAFALVRSTTGLLAYASFGLLPALIYYLVRAAAPVELRRDRVEPISYYTPDPLAHPARSVSTNGYYLASVLGLLVAALSCVYFWQVDVIHVIAVDNAEGQGRMLAEHRLLALYLGLAAALRLFSEPAAAILQARGAISTDNWIVVSSELLWLILSMLMFGSRIGHDDYVTETTVPVAVAYLIASLYLRLARGFFASGTAPDLSPKWSFATTAGMWQLLGFGSLVLLAQVADFLYAPIDFILINRLLSTDDLAAYAPAVQIDSALLVLVTGLSAVLLPKAAVAYAERNNQLIRQYYLRATTASLAILLPGALAVYLLSPWIFRFWLGDAMPATQALLPLVLINTVVGGSAAVGRSILLGMGKVKPFTIAVLLAGVSNVLLSYVFVRYVGWGLKGIVLGTIVVVVARAGIWMPWYTLRAIREAENAPVLPAAPAPPFSPGS